MEPCCSARRGLLTTGVPPGGVATGPRTPPASPCAPPGCTCVCVGLRLCANAQVHSLGWPRGQVESHAADFSRRAAAAPHDSHGAALHDIFVQPSEMVEF